MKAGKPEGTVSMKAPSISNLLAATLPASVSLAAQAKH